MLIPTGGGIRIYVDFNRNAYTDTRGRRGLVVKVLDFHAGGRGFDSRSGQAAQ